MGKDLKEKAINIKGKDYVQVANRILYFNDTYTGSIKTSFEVVDLKDDKQAYVVHAVVIPEEGREFHGSSQAVIGEGYINKTSALENAETSAVGRALAMMGIGVIESVASADEINKSNDF